MTPEETEALAESRQDAEFWARKDVGALEERLRTALAGYEDTKLMHEAADALEALQSGSAGEVVAWRHRWHYPAPRGDDPTATNWAATTDKSVADYKRLEGHEVDPLVVATPAKAAGGHPYEDFNAAINFAVDHARMEAETFLRSWREGDWTTLDREWPEWVALMASPSPDGERQPDGGAE